MAGQYAVIRRRSTSIGSPLARMVPGCANHPYLPRSASDPCVVAAQGGSWTREQAPRLLDRLPVLELYSATSLILRWHHVIALHREYQARYTDRYMLLRFEDFITEPLPSVKRLFSHVGVEFSEKMLDQVVLNSSFVSRGESKGFDPAVIDRWRDHMSSLTRRWFAALCGRELQAFGYVP